MGNGSTAALRYEAIGYTEILGNPLVRTAPVVNTRYNLGGKAATVQENIWRSIS